MKPSLARILFFSGSAALLVTIVLIFFVGNEIPGGLKITLFLFQCILLGGLLFLFLSKPKGRKKKRTNRKSMTQEEAERKAEIRKARRVAKERRIKESAEVLLKNIADKETLESLGEVLLKNFAQEWSIVRGLVYSRTGDEHFRSVAQYAYYGTEAPPDFVPGEGLNGQVAQDKKPRLLDQISEQYIEVVSGLGAGYASNLLIIPFVSGGKTIALAELASLEEFPEHTMEVLKKVQKNYAKTFKKIMQ